MPVRIRTSVKSGGTGDRCVCRGGVKQEKGMGSGGADFKTAIKDANFKTARVKQIW